MLASTMTAAVTVKRWFGSSRRYGTRFRIITTAARNEGRGRGIVRQNLRVERKRERNGGRIRRELTIDADCVGKMGNYYEEKELTGETDCGERNMQV